MDKKKMKNKKYLIEYTAWYDNNKELGKDESFWGDGIFYIRAKNWKEAKSASLKKIRERFKKIKISFDRIEEAAG